MITILVLSRTGGGPPRSPSAFPLGRAALELAGEGIQLVFGDQVRDGHLVHGLMATSRQTWGEVRQREVHAVYDRFPSQKEPDRFQSISEALVGLPFGNPPSLSELCRDKLRCQRLLESSGVVMPELEQEPSRFNARLVEWGAGFLKPRFGSYGRGVARFEAGETPPPRTDGLYEEEESLLQRAVSPPQVDGLGAMKGCGVRALVQRVPEGWWWCAPLVVRYSNEDPVANAARGAKIVDEEALPPSWIRGARALAQKTALVLDSVPRMSGRVLLEVGVDLVFEEGGRPIVIEVNGKPQGRLKVLAEKWPERYEVVYGDALNRPFRCLASWARDAVHVKKSGPTGL